MTLQGLMLSREDIRIIDRGQGCWGHRYDLRLPIARKLLEEHRKLDEGLAYEVFAEAVERYLS